MTRGVDLADYGSIGESRLLLIVNLFGLLRIMLLLTVRSFEAVEEVFLLNRWFWRFEVEVHYFCEISLRILCECTRGAMGIVAKVRHEFVTQIRAF